MNRVEAVAKVTGRGRYAAEYPVDGLAYAWPVQSPIACGQIRRVDARAALAMPGVIMVLSADTTAPFGLSS
jgi:xanthine dehydrogenase YagR molybdenum-binding subunit